MASMGDPPVSGPPARPDPVEFARAQIQAWWEQSAAATHSEEELLELLEWQLAVQAECERILGEERAVTLRRLSREAGSIRKLSERISRPYSTLRGQMA